MKDRSIVVVADGGQARILRPQGTGFAEIVRLERDSARQPARALVTDRTGRVFDSGGRVGQGPKTHARHGAQSDYDPHAGEVERFAKRLSRRLDAECRGGAIDEVVLIAEPRFLGTLRRQISAATRKLIKREIASDLAHADDIAVGQAAFPR